MANNNNAKSAPENAVAPYWNDQDFQRAMGWQSVCKLAIVATVLLTAAIIATTLVVNYLGSK